MRACKRKGGMQGEVGKLGRKDKCNTAWMVLKKEGGFPRQPPGNPSRRIRCGSF